MARGRRGSFKPHCDQFHRPYHAMQCSAMPYHACQFFVFQVESLNMNRVLLDDVDSQLLSNAVVRVKRVDISDTRLTPDQGNTIWRTIIENESVKKLEKLNMSDVDLSDVDSKLWASAVVRVKIVDTIQSKT